VYHRSAAHRLLNHLNPGGRDAGSSFNENDGDRSPDSTGQTAASSGASSSNSSSQNARAESKAKLGALIEALQRCDCDEYATVRTLEEMPLVPSEVYCQVWLRCRVHAD